MLAKAKAAAETALRLQPELGEGHLALAFYHYYSSRDYEAAIRELTLAQRALPNDPMWPAHSGDRAPARALGGIDSPSGARPPARSAEYFLALESFRNADLYAALSGSGSGSR